MIRKLTEQDRGTLLQYLAKDSSYNIFIIGDVETFGFDKEWQTLYGEFDQNDQYLSVILFYRENSIYYSHEDIFNLEYLQLITKHKSEYISGKSTLMNLIYPHLFGFKSQLEHFCRATSLKEMTKNRNQIKVLTTEEDFSKLYDLLCTVKEFGVDKKDRANFIESKINSLAMSYTLGIIKDDKIVATAATTADTTNSSMIVGVATHHDYRKCGYASSLVTAIMDEYINNRSKELCLFYDNPKAGKIYLRLGFENIGTWTMLVKE